MNFVKIEVHTPCENVEGNTVKKIHYIRWNIIDEIEIQEGFKDAIVHFTKNDELVTAVNFDKSQMEI